MSTTDVSPPRVAQLAGMIELDIRRRGLSAGDTYLTSDQVGQMFGVHARMASRAMVILADRKVLERRRGVGTFVGPKAPPPSSVAIKCVHVLITDERLRTGFDSNGLMAGLMQAIPGTSLQFHQLPSHGAEAQVRSILQFGQSSGAMLGLVLVGCPRGVQQVVARSGVPALVFGTTHQDTSQLLSLDIDHRESGFLAAEYLRRRGRQRWALVLHETWLPGDNHLGDGIMDAMAQPGVRRPNLTVRSVPADPKLIEAEVRGLLESDDRPTGWIVCGELFCRSTLQEIARHDLVIGRDLDVVRVNYDALLEPAPGLPVLTPELDFGQRSREAAAMLARQIGVAEGGQSEPHRRVRVTIVQDPSERSQI